VNLAALLLPFIVALPSGAAAPPPGALPAGAQVSALDRELGLVLVRLPKRGVAPALRRLRAAPGVRSVERDAPLGLAGVGEGCTYVGREDVKADPGWRAAIHLSQRSAAGMLIGIADSGVDDDRLAPRQAPLLSYSAGGPERPQDPLGHGTAVASMLVANRPDVKVVGLVPDATLLSARIVRSENACSGPVFEHGLITALGWLRRDRAQVVNVSATAQRSSALVDSLRALELSGALIVASVGNHGTTAQDRYPAQQSGVLGVGALEKGSTKQVWKYSTRGPQVDLVAPAEGIRVILSTAIAKTDQFQYTPPGTSFSAPLVTAAAAMVWATHRDWTAAEVANALVRSAKPLGPGAPSRNWGYGILDVSRALHTAKLPDPHEPNDWVAAALLQRPLHPGAVVVASLGWAGDHVDAYAVDVPAGTSAKAVLRSDAQGVTLQRLPIGTTNAALDAVADLRAHPSEVALPPGRSLVVVARRQGAGPYTLSLSGS
jgi:subtilisin family serine protease